MSVPKTHIAKLRQKKSRFLWSHNNNLQTSIRSISPSIRCDERKSGSTPAATLRKWMFVEEMRWKWQRQPHDINKPLLLRDNGPWFALRKTCPPCHISSVPKNLFYLTRYETFPCHHLFKTTTKTQGFRKRTLLGLHPKKKKTGGSWLDRHPLTSKRA